MEDFSIYKQLCAVSTELEKYVELEGTELGEACQSLLDLVSRTDYLSDGFDELLLAELNYHLDKFKKYSKIVESTETKEITNTFTELEWIEE